MLVFQCQMMNLHSFSFYSSWSESVCFYYLLSGVFFCLNSLWLLWYQLEDNPLFGLGGDYMQLYSFDQISSSFSFFSHVLCYYIKNWLKRCWSVVEVPRWLEQGWYMVCKWRELFSMARGLLGESKNMSRVVPKMDEEIHWKDCHNVINIIRAWRFKSIFNGY